VERIKILQISVRSDIGGGPKHLLGLVEDFQSRNVTLYIAAPVEGEFANELKKNCKQFIPIPFRTFSIFSFIQLLILCKREGISIVHSHGRGAGIYSRLLALFGIRILHTFHGVHNESSFKGKIKLLTDKILVPFTSKFICVSESEKDTAILHKVTNTKRTHVISNGVCIPDLEGNENENLTIKVGTLSRCNYQKGLDILIEYISRYSANCNDDFICEIAGDGELKKELEDLNQCSKIKFLGNIDPNSFLREIDIYISFARWEGLPLGVLEAMASGRACLLSDVVGNRDLVTPNISGKLFSLGDYNEFEDSFRDLLSSFELRKNLGDKARLNIQKNYSLKLMCDKTFDIYSTM
jgi:glycosyltransferase involved in cell wall biosynthesis